MPDQVTVRTMDTLHTGQTSAPETFDSVNPATSEVIATFPVMGQAEVAAALERAREAAGWWVGLGWKDRQTRLLAWKSHLTRYIGRLAELVHAETGKPLGDAQLEILLAIVHIDWAARNAHYRHNRDRASSPGARCKPNKDAVRSPPSGRLRLHRRGGFGSAARRRR